MRKALPAVLTAALGTRIVETTGATVEAHTGVKARPSSPFSCPGCTSVPCICASLACRYLRLHVCTLQQQERE